MWTTLRRASRLLRAPIAVPPASEPLLQLTPEFYSGPPSADAYQSLPASIAGVRVVRPRGTNPGSTAYPYPMASPPTPAGSPALGYSEWKHFRAERLDPIPKPWDFPADFDNPTCAWLQVLKRLYALPVTFPSSIAPEAGLMLHSIVRNARPKVVIETGTFLGASALWIAAALKECGGVLHCFDDFIPIRPGPWRLHEMREGVLEHVAASIAEAGLTDHVVLHPGNTSFEIRACRDELAAQGGVQLAYLDADHRPMGVAQDLWAVEPLLPTGALVVLHDTFPGVCGDDGPRFLLDHVNELAVGRYSAVDLFTAPINYGMGIMRRVG